jgi:hypothetical protein
VEEICEGWGGGRWEVGCFNFFVGLKFNERERER